MLFLLDLEGNPSLPKIQLRGLHLQHQVSYLVLHSNFHASELLVDSI
jgi:hypothetical protein